MYYRETRGFATINGILLLVTPRKYVKMKKTVPNTPGSFDIIASEISSIGPKIEFPAAERENVSTRVYIYTRM